MDEKGSASHPGYMYFYDQSDGAVRDGDSLQ